MKIKRIKEECFNVEVYKTDKAMVYFEDDIYRDETLETLETISVLLEGTYFLFDNTSLYKIDTEQDIFDIVNDSIDDSCGADFEIIKYESIMIFIDEVVGQENFISDLQYHYDKVKNIRVEEYIDEVLFENGSVLKDDGSIITLEEIF